MGMGRYFRELPRGLKTTQLPLEYSPPPRTFQDIINQRGSGVNSIAQWLDVLRNQVDEAGNLLPIEQTWPEEQVPTIKELLFKRLYPYFFGAGKPREVLTNLEPDVRVPYPGDLHANPGARIGNSLTPIEREQFFAPSRREEMFPARANILYFNNIYRHLAGQMDQLVPGWKKYEDYHKQFYRGQDLFKLTGQGTVGDESPFRKWQDKDLGHSPPIPYPMNMAKNAKEAEIIKGKFGLGRQLSDLHEKLISDTNPIQIRRAAVNPVVEWYKLRQRLGIDP